MPIGSVWLVRGALLNFVLGITIGALLLAEKGILLPPVLWRLRSLHAELLLFGFMVQIAFGVALWILPRQGGRPSTKVPWAAVTLLNAGVWMTGLGGGVLEFSTFELLGHLAKAGSIADFARRIWPRLAELRRSHGTA